MAASCMNKTFDHHIPVLLEEAVSSLITTTDGIYVDLGLKRRLTPTECEKLQTVPLNYTDCVSDSQRYKMIGNGWTVDVIAHVFGRLS